MVTCTFSNPDKPQASCQAGCKQEAPEVVFDLVLRLLAVTRTASHPPLKLCGFLTSRDFTGVKPRLIWGDFTCERVLLMFWGPSPVPRALSAPVCVSFERNGNWRDGALSIQECVKDWSWWKETIDNSLRWLSSMLNTKLPPKKKKVGYLSNNMLKFWIQFSSLFFLSLKNWWYILTSWHYYSS